MFLKGRKTTNAASAGLDPNHIITARQVVKTYATGSDQVQALKSVDFSVRRGEMVAVMGPSGCGKTTLLNSLSGLDDITSGQIWLEGKDLAKMGDRERTTYRAQRMGFIFQVYNLLPGPLRRRERRTAAPRLRSEAERGPGPVGGGVGAGGTGQVGQAPPGGALRWPAPARHHRPLAGQQPGADLGR